MEEIKAENEKYVVVCDEAGSIIIKDKETIIMNTQGLISAALVAMQQSG